jgi:hypothetical protein
LTDGALYRFIQFEFPWPLGPEDGRYLLRGHAGEDAHHVVVFGTVTAPVRPRRRRWGRPDDATAAPAETGVGVATVIDPATVDEATAQAWLEGVTSDDAAIDEAVFWLNATLRAQRAAAADRDVREVSEAVALTVRAGYGEGFEVADGEWHAAVTVPRRPDRGLGGRSTRRLHALRPQERLAALLAGRDAVLACEELVLRARADLEARRPREAALQAQIALDAALAELAAFRGQTDLDKRLTELAELRPGIADAAAEALQGGPAPATVEAVEHAVDRLEAALRARAAFAAY